MTSTAANNVVAMAAAVKGSPPGPGTLNRRTSKASFGPRGPDPGSYPSMPSSLPNNGEGFGPGSYGAGDAKNGTAVTDGPPLASMPEGTKTNSKARIRRASEGARQSKGDGKRTSGSELRCEKCGKGYKHSSCLTKHLWEHTPEWAITSKLLISKHQQVQLLEAASVLVAMNQDADAAKHGDSDHSSVSPAASGSSDLHEDDSSSNDTTPPPQADEHVFGSYSARHSQYGQSKRFSTQSSVLSQSHRSSNSVFSDSAPNGHYMSHYRQWSNDGRPTTSATSVTGSHYDDEEQADLAAAVGLLSCSYGTPKSGPVTLPADVPPVPPLPARFLSQIGNSTIAAHGPQRHSTPRPKYTSYASEGRDVDMDDEGLMDEDYDDRHYAARGRSDEDEGVFGTMEE
ncbi:hypothetical protein W97_02670 [Coniosporium apollinis CBS 100218]|uniref:C2H2-type domain-containing protein n=1 Tax=Coniosporium apollinis (strain CBS 100218) TaxID=1168221 RepID=R7YNG8_CONA1|nr:uncharacterized protein W97_02670 [Coniosporium apollinis CBS 100218]EON63442.1 hypothetical protein W97_02670 [Coniosporium apollinis CBS 100218]